MRGRFQALLVAVASAGSLLFCWISAAVRGAGPAAQGRGSRCLVVSLGAVAVRRRYCTPYGDSGPLSLLLGTALLAAVLRSTVSLPLALLTSVVGVVS